MVLVVTHHLPLLLSFLTVKGIVGQYYSQHSQNNHYYNRNFNGNLLRYPDAAMKQQDMIAEVNEQSPGQTPCRNKDANKEHKDSLWWTLPIPPMEFEGLPERPPQIVKPPEPVAINTKPQQSAGGETGAIEQKHGQFAVSSTAKPQPAPTPAAAAQVATTSKHEASSTPSSKLDRNKVTQMQKQGPAPQAQSAPLPSQQVVSNKESNQQMINKSVATMRAPGSAKASAPIMAPHGPGKQKAMLMDGQYLQESIPMQQSYLNNPYFNPTYFREPQYMANPGYISDNTLDNSVAELADTYKGFNTNEAELGGAAVIGENAFGNKIHPSLVQYNNFAPIKQQADSWIPLTEDERNKRNPMNKYEYDTQRIAIS